MVFFRNAQRRYVGKPDVFTFCFARQDIKYPTFAGQQFHCAEIRLQESPQVSGRILSDLTYNRLWFKSDELVEDQSVGSAGVSREAQRAGAAGLRGQNPR